jgi:hypothetical protein
MAAKFNLLSSQMRLGDFETAQVVATDLTDKATVICLYVFGQSAVFSFAGNDLRHFNQLVNEIDEEVSQLDLALDKHGEMLLCKLSEHLQIETYPGCIPAKAKEEKETASVQFYSISQLSRMHGLNAKPQVFDLLVREGIIEKATKYVLTPKGIEIGGEYRTGDDGGKWPVWPESALLPYLLDLKRKHINALPFERFYHITHLDNLKGILASGILPHQNSSQRVDISDGAVQDRRRKKDSVHNLPIHSYTPLYLNPRNAMMYRVQEECGDSIVVLGVRKKVLESNKFIFSDMNAASDMATFSNDLEKLCGRDWLPVFQKSWSADGVTNLSAKSTMMAECLIANSVDVIFLDSILCLTRRTMDRAEIIINNFRHLNVYLAVDHRVFFG